MSAAAADRQRCRLIAADLTFSSSDCRKPVWELQIESGTRDIDLLGRVLTSHVRFRAMSAFAQTGHEPISPIDRV